MKQSGYSVALIGATGVVGTEILRALGERDFPLAELRPYASLRSAGDEITCSGITARVDPLDDTAQLGGTDLVFLAATEQVTAEWAEHGVAAGAVVIDTSGLFTDAPDVPLVVPEVNAGDIALHDARGVISSPDTAAIALAVVLAPLHAAAGIRRIVVTSFESASGAGHAGVEELRQQTVELMNGRNTDHTVFPQRLAFNAFPHIGEFLAGGLSRGEAQSAHAVRRLLNEPDLAVSMMRVRVPLFYGAALAVNIETADKLGVESAREILRAAPGVMLHDDAANQQYPTPADSVGGDAVDVGRLRADETLPVIDCWITIDNTRKGSAVNAVQIAEVVVREYR